MNGFDLILLTATF